MKLGALIVRYTNRPCQTKVKLNPNDIARVAGYIVCYTTTQVNLSCQNEKDSIAALIDNASTTECIGNDEGEIIRSSRQILNSFMNTVVSKAE